MDPIALASKLIAMQSISPNDANCQVLIAKYLSQHGFHIEHLPYGKVNNLWATHGTTKPLFVFAGHTDVVPPGKANAWDNPPFQPLIKNGYLYGRGAVDMKGGLAAMLAAIILFVQKYPQHLGTIGLLLTSDEEGKANNGSKKVIQYLQQKNITFDYCLLAEPTSEVTIADTIKIGRRGSMLGTLKVFGIPGHVAYSEKIKNPIAAILPILTTLQNNIWDHGNSDFPPTTLQFTNIIATSPATNITPAKLQIKMAIRFSPLITAQQLQEKITTLLSKLSLDYTITWKINAEPFITKKGALVTATQDAIFTNTGYFAKITNNGGTSDGRFIAAICPEIIELGPINTYAHKINEQVSCNDLQLLTTIYQQLLLNILKNN